MLYTYVLLLPKRTRTVQNSGVALLLLGFALTCVLQAVFMDLGSPGLAFVGMLARMGLVVSVVYSAVLLGKFVGSIRDEARDDFNKKLEVEFTDRRKIEQELAHLASFVEQDPNCIVELDSHGRLRYANSAAERTLGDLKTLGKNHPIMEGLDAAVALLRQEKRMSVTRNIEYGNRMYRQQIGLLETSPDIRIHMVDVTELKRLEQNQIYFRGRFPDELQAPLRAVQEKLQHMVSVIRSHLNGEQQEELMMALRRLGDINRFSEELIQKTSQETTRIEIRRQLTDLVAMAKQVAGFIAPLAQTRGLTIGVVDQPATLEILLDREKVLTALSECIQKASETCTCDHLEISFLVKGSIAYCFVTPAAKQPLPVKPISGQEADFTNATAILNAHGGNLEVQPLPAGLACTLKIPILSADDFFCERVRNLHEAALARGETLSLLRLHLLERDRLQSKLGEVAASALWAQLHQAVGNSLRTDSDFAIQARQSIWLALPGASRTEGLLVAERIERAFSDYAQGQSIGEPITIEKAIANYPEDGRTVESLLSKIRWIEEVVPPQSLPTKPNSVSVKLPKSYPRAA